MPLLSRSLTSSRITTPTMSLAHKQRCTVLSLMRVINKNYTRFETITQYRDYDKANFAPHFTLIHNHAQTCSSPYIKTTIATMLLTSMVSLAIPMIIRLMLGTAGSNGANRR